MGYQLELRHFKYFIAVAEELHYRKAAEILCISQPGLSRQIKQMEEILGIQLFIRSKKKVSLTAAGEYLKVELEFILNHLEVATKQLKIIDGGEYGEVRIGFLGSAMQNVIPNLLVKLKDNFPRIKTSLEELSNGAQINAIVKDKLDLGFIRLSRVPEGLIKKTVQEDTFSVVLPESYPILTRDFDSVEILKNEDFIMFSQDYSPLYYDTVMSICEEAGFTPNISHKSVHAHTIFKLVENNLGVAIVPTALQYGFHMRVKFIELKNIPQRAILSAVWKEDNRNKALSNCTEMLFLDEK
ncbi:LysR family transcriptional regulator [Maribacter sp.]|uniref:LysR family transcriptional regulator n=1 Tax=Maribacter sp. TaxID=1897614 RepID=UPI0025C36306|nr:LysR family transcriptional regulator [Maribacter sp.]